MSNLRPGYAAPVYVVDLDANSTSSTDILIQPSATDVKSFRIGAIINASAIAPLANVQGWEFFINYNASAFIPQGDPNPAAFPGNFFGLYPDGASNTVLFGGQITTGTVNWAGKLTAGTAFSVVTITTSGQMGHIDIAYTILGVLGVNTAVTIAAANLLANVNFELLNKPSTPQAFTITNLIFVDNTAHPISFVSAGTGATETVTNDPPHATFSSTPAPQVGPYAITFNATASSDTDDTIPKPGGYFWDFGDGSQDLGLAGPVVTHDFLGVGKFNVTLRVQDLQLATGAARDSLGAVIVNTQPSHVFEAVNVIPRFPDFTITSDPKSLGIQSGTIVTSTITMTSFNSFAGEVSLTATVRPVVSNPPGVSSDKQTVKLVAGGTNSSTLTASILSTTPLVQYNVTVTGTSGTLSHNTTIVLVPTTLRVDPGLLTGVVKGGTFKLNIAVSAAALFSWQFQLNYDRTLLSTSFTSVSFGPYWQPIISRGQAFRLVQVNQTAGTVIVAFTLLDRNLAFNGNGTLISITFTVTSYGRSDLQLSKAFLINNVGLGQPMPFIQRDGVFDNRLPDDVAVTSVNSQPDKANVGDPVSITVGLVNKGLNAETVTVTAFAGDKSIGQKQVSLNPGDTTTITIPWDTKGSSPGTYTIKALAAITNDGDPEDNTLSGKTVTLEQGGQAGGFSISPLILYISGGGIAIVAAAIVAFLLLRRRRQTSGPVS